MRISDWSSDVCSSDLRLGQDEPEVAAQLVPQRGADSQQARQRRRAEAEHRPAVAHQDERRAHRQDENAAEQIGSESCRECVWQYGAISVVACSLKKKHTDTQRRILQNTSKKKF